MKKAAIFGERQAGLIEVPTPHAREDWALVEVQCIPMCTEYKMFVAGHRSEFLGHEAVGRVVEVAQPGRVGVGDRVVVQPLMACGRCALCIAGDYIHCQNAMDVKTFTGSPEGSATYAQYVLKPSWLLSPIPDEVSFEMAGLALCALGPSMGGLEAMGVEAFDTVLITGMGPVGLGGVVNAKYRGARVIAVESVTWRQDKARQLGADVVIDPGDGDALAQVMALTDGRGVDKSLDCSGVVAAQRFCIDATRRKGQATFVGECSDQLPVVVSPDLIRKGLTLRGSWHYNLNLYPKVMQVIRESPVAGDLISHRFPLRQVQEALQVSASHQCAKIMLNPWA